MTANNHPTNHQFRLAARPVGAVKRSDFNYVEAPVRSPGDNEVLVKTLFLSLDPAMRGWMNEGKSYIAPVQLGEVMRAGGVGKVIESKHPKFNAGDFVTGTLGVQEYATLDGKGLGKVDPGIAPLPVYLGTLGMPGMTASRSPGRPWLFQARPVRSARSSGRSRRSKAVARWGSRAASRSAITSRSSSASMPPSTTSRRM
jgi:NADPH-dependent curcumin reductase CurA